MLKRAIIICVASVAVLPFLPEQPPKTIDNENVVVKYYENDDGSWEVYVHLKDEVLTEVPVSDDGLSVKIVPDEMEAK